MTVIFCLHYFLWYGAHCAIFGYESVYARHYTNATTVQYGTLRMMLPFVSVIMTPIICSMADRRRMHRTFFVTSLVTAFLSMVAYAMLPLSIGQLQRADGQLGYWWFGRYIGSKSDGLLIGPWIYYCLNSLAYDLSLATNVCLSDSFAVLKAEESGSSFGRIIVWGTFGWASSALVLSLINQVDFMPRLLPGLVFACILLTVDVIFVSNWPANDDFILDLIAVEAASTVTGSSSTSHKDPSDYLPSNESAKIKLGQDNLLTISPRPVAQVAKADQAYTVSLGAQLHMLWLIMKRRKSLIRFFVLFIMSGFFMSMHWNYFFLYLENIFTSQFELVSALSMVCQSLLGELPFFILSRKLIDLLGRSHTISVSLISIGLRFLLYQYLLPSAGRYFIFVADVLQGPNYGLFYVVMTEVGFEYSYCDEDTIGRMAAMAYIDPGQPQQVDALRLALRSTVQSVAFACYEGLGVGLGSLVGGCILAANYDFELLWMPMACASIAIGLFNILLETFCRESDPEEESSTLGRGPQHGISVTDMLASRRLLEATGGRLVKTTGSPRGPRVPAPLTLALGGGQTAGSASRLAGAGAATPAAQVV